MELIKKLMNKPAKMALFVVVVLALIFAIRKGWMPTTYQILKPAPKPEQ